MSGCLSTFILSLVICNHCFDASDIILYSKMDSIEEEMLQAQQEQDIAMTQPINLHHGSTDPEKNSKAPTPEMQESLLISFDEPYDAENPKDWPKLKKWSVTLVLSATGFNRISVSTMMAPALTKIADEFRMSNVESAFALSVFLVATAFGPLIIGPLSEIYGRKPILHATNIWFLIWDITCGFANSGNCLIVARCFAGLGASAIYALAGGVLGDVWRPEERGTSLGLYLLVPLLGAAIGPIVGGVIAQNTTWRWMFWGTSIVQAVLIVASALAFHETCAPIILQRRADKLRRTLDRPDLYTKAEKYDEGLSARTKLLRCLSRPLRLLAFHPIIQVMTLMTGFSYGITYLIITSLSDLWVNQYVETVSRSGLHYLSLCLGEILGAVIGGPAMDYTFRRLKAHADGEVTPEYRVPLMLPVAVITPIGFLMYGWVAQAHAYWLLVDIGDVIINFGLQVGGQAVQAYVIDSYPEHVSSASAASQVLRGLAAATFPLFAPSMYSAMGYGWGNTLLALVTLAIGLAIPLLIWFHGAGLRANATPI
jgi:MFS family permease